jgi:hypothetical protein
MHTTANIIHSALAERMKFQKDTEICLLSTSITQKKTALNHRKSKQLFCDDKYPFAFLIQEKNTSL